MLRILQVGFLVSCSAAVINYDLSDLLQSWVRIPSPVQPKPEAAPLTHAPYTVFDLNDTDSSIWSKTNIQPGGTYEIEMMLSVTSTGNMGSQPVKFDGLAIWMAAESSVEDIVNGRYKEDGSPKDYDLFGYRSDYVGYGTFFSLSNRLKGIKPSVSSLFGVGQHAAVTRAMIPTEFGRYWNFAEAYLLNVKIEVDNESVTLSARDVDGNGKAGEWIVVSAVKGPTKVGGHLGISASAHGPSGSPSAKVELLSIQYSTSDQAYSDLARASQATSSLVNSLEGAESTDIHAALFHMMAELKSQQQDIQSSLDSLIAGISGRSHTDTHLHKALVDLKKDLREKHHDTQQQSEVSLKNLQANAASLESTVRKATTYSTYFACGLSASFLGFAGLIYKRMKDMEKKHFL